MGPLDKYILKDDALTATKAGFQLQFQSHWYRSLPLSCMDFSLKVNDKTVNTKNVMIEANGNKYAYSEMPNLDKEWLFIIERATIHVAYPKPLKTGQTYKIEFNLDVYPPYILVGSESKPLLAGSRVIKSLVCQ